MILSCSAQICTFASRSGWREFIVELNIIRDVGPVIAVRYLGRDISGAVCIEKGDGVIRSLEARLGNINCTHGGRAMR
jgi:hypothetical protein